MQDSQPLQPVARICQHGRRRAQAVACLQRLVCARAYNLTGHFDAEPTCVGTPHAVH